MNPVQPVTAGVVKLAYPPTNVVKPAGAIEAVAVLTTTLFRKQSRNTALPAPTIERRYVNPFCCGVAQAKS